MNRRELFGTRIFNHETHVDTNYLPFINRIHRGFCDVNFPRFFSGWPYLIFVLAALLMGSAKFSSQGFTDQENRWVSNAFTHQNLASTDWSGPLWHSGKNNTYKIF